MHARERGWLWGGVAFLALGFLAGTGNSQEVQVRQIVPGGQAAATYLVIPGFYMLASEDVQKELELVEDQMNKLRKIAAEYQEQMRTAWAGVGELPAEQRAAKWKEIQEKTQEMAEAARGKAQEVLLAHQLDRLKKLTVRSRAQYSLHDPRLQQEIGLDENQRKQLAELRTELLRRMKELNDEMLDKVVGVLTPEQSKKLEDSTWNSLNQGFGYGGVTVPERKKTE